MNKDTFIVGVAGAGAMGSGIAQTAAAAGFRVVLYARRPEVLEEAFQNMRASLAKLHEKGIAVESPDSILSRVTPVQNPESLSVCGLVVESIAEQMDIKCELLKKLAHILSDSAILASTTSSLSMTALGTASGIPARFIGMHFMNPVPLMEVVELIAGEQTSPQTVAFAQEMTVALGKTFVNCKDQPGFIITRLLGVMMNEAFRMLRDEVATAEEIDTAMKLGAHHPMGPFALADMVGLDIIQAALETLSTGLESSGYTPSPLLRDFVAKGRLGKKSGHGVYSYQQEGLSNEK